MNKDTGSHSVNPLIYRELRFLKNHIREGSRFSFKNGGNPYKGVVYRRGGLARFSLVRYGFAAITLLTQQVFH